MRPNIVFILSDDQGAWAMHNAGTKELYTPNLDRIAAQGVRCSDFFCVSPVCSPARASLITGTIPSAHGVHDWLRSGNLDGERYKEQGEENPYFNGYSEEVKPIGYLDDQICYTDLLAANGYTCALSGKWHLGDSIRPQHGFSKWYTMGIGGCCYYHPDMVEDGKVTIEHGRYVTEVITDRALMYLDAMSQEEAPFYLSVHYTAPHDPWGPEHHPKKWIDYYKECDFESIPDVPDHPWSRSKPTYGTDARRQKLTGYYAAISAMDEQIGRILGRLEELQILENTIIVFCGDNGMSMGHHGIWGKGNGTFPLNMYDSAVKVPFLISWKGRLPEGKVCEQMMSAYDWFPTLMELVGIPYEDVSKPGTSRVSALYGTSQNMDAEDAVVVYDEYGPVRMIRTREWKYVHRYPYGPFELYHLQEDPDEEMNLYEDAAYMDKVEELRAKLGDWFFRYVDPAVDGAHEGVTGAGQLCRAGVFAKGREAFAEINY